MKRLSALITLLILLCSASFADCAQQADVQYLQCRESGKPQEFCQELTDFWYCECLGGYYLGGGFCLIMSIAPQLPPTMRKLSRPRCPIE